MTIGEDLMQKYPIGVTERICREIDMAVDNELVGLDRLRIRMIWAVAMLGLAGFVGGVFIGFFVARVSS